MCFLYVQEWVYLKKWSNWKNRKLRNFKNWFVYGCFVAASSVNDIRDRVRSMGVHELKSLNYYFGDKEYPKGCPAYIQKYFIKKELKRRGRAVLKRSDFIKTY